MGLISRVSSRTYRYIHPVVVSYLSAMFRLTRYGGRSLLNRSKRNVYNRPIKRKGGYNPEATNTGLAVLILGGAGIWATLRYREYREALRPSSLENYKKLKAMLESQQSNESKVVLTEQPVEIIDTTVEDDI